MRYVILGSSIAGLSAARAIREQDTRGEIVIVTTEAGRPYYRPLIPLLIEGSKQESDLALGDDPLGRLNANMSVRAAERVDTKRKTVYLSGKKKLAYDRLLIATGARPIVPKTPGLAGKHLHLLRTMADAKALRQAAAMARHVVVIGGGMVGIKAATALRHLADPPQVTVVEKEDHLLPLRLDAQGAEIVGRALEQDGVVVMTDTTVVSLSTKKGRPSAVRLSGNRSLPADLVIAAIGVRPNREFLKGSGIRMSSGVLVDNGLRTSAPDVYAAGDVAEWCDASAGNPFVSALWSNAVEMGRIAGLNMAGNAAQSRGFLPVMNAAEIAGVPFISAGIVEPGKGFESAAARRNGTYRKVVMQGDRVVGMSFVGDIRNAGVYVSMIRNRVPITRSRDRFLRGAATYADVATGSGST
jgi:NAD(P)H-nitrite reductase large subunit